MLLSLPSHILCDTLTLLRPSYVRHNVDVDADSLLARRALHEEQWRELFGALRTCRALFVQCAPVVLRRALERLFQRRVSVDAVAQLLVLSESESTSDAVWRSAIAWLRYLSTAVHSTLHFRDCIAAMVDPSSELVHLQLESLYWLMLPCSVPARQFALSQLIFQVQFGRWQAQAVIGAFCVHLFQSGHAAAAECLARLCLDADWHRRILFQFATALFKSDVERSHALLKSCVSLPTEHEKTPAVHAELDAAALEPVSKDEAIRFVERCMAALRVPTLSVGRQDEEQLDGVWVDERQFLYDLCLDVIAEIRSFGHASGAIADIPRLVQRDWQTLGTIGYSLALMRDEAESRRAFELARELRAASPYPTARPSQARLEKYELLAAIALKDTVLFDARFQAQFADLANAGADAVRAMLSDVATVGRFDLHARIVATCGTGFRPAHLASLQATSLCAAVRNVSSLDSEAVLAASRAVLATLVQAHTPTASRMSSLDDAERAEQLDLWLELARASVFLGASAELTTATGVLEAAFGRPMLRSMIDVVVATVEAQGVRTLPTTCKIELKIAACEIGLRIMRQLERPGVLSVSLLLEVTKLAAALLDHRCAGAARDLIAAHEHSLDAISLDDALAPQLLVDIVSLMLRLRRADTAARFIAQALSTQQALAALRNAVCKQGQFVVAVKILCASQSHRRSDAIVEIARDWARSFRFQRNGPNGFAPVAALAASLPLTASERFGLMGGFVSGLLVDAKVDLFDDNPTFYSATGLRDLSEPVRRNDFVYALEDIQADLRQSLGVELEPTA